MTIQKTAIIGMGALGLMYGCQIAERLGDEAVEFVMDETHYQKYHNQTFYKNGKPLTLRIVNAKEATPADLVIVAVKYRSLGSALKTMQHSIDDHTILMSVMNGIDSEKQIGKVYGETNLIYTVAQAMDVLKKNTSITVTTPGLLCVGICETVQKPALKQLAAFLEQVNLPFQIEKDIMHRIWGKFMLNTGVNQTCMVYETDYSGIQKSGEARNVFKGAMREVMALSEKVGICLTEQDYAEYLKLADSMAPEGMPSMRCDGLLKHYSEVEMFAGTVLRMAEHCHLDVPYNTYLYNRIKAIEETY